MNERSATAALTATYRDLMDDPTAVPAAPAPATVSLAAVEKLLADTLALQADHQDQMNHLANTSTEAVNTPGTLSHGIYHRALAARDALTAPLMGLQALINTARKA